MQLDCCTLRTITCIHTHWQIRLVLLYVHVVYVWMITPHILEGGKGPMPGPSNKNAHTQLNEQEATNRRRLADESAIPPHN